MLRFLIVTGDYHSIEIEKDEQVPSEPTPQNPAVLSAKSQGRFLQRKISFQVGVNVTKIPSKPVIEVPVESKPAEQTPIKARQTSDSSNESSDSDVFDDAIFDKFEQPEELNPGDKEGWNLLQLIYSKIQNPYLKPANPEEDLQVKMLSLLLTDDM